jgi:5-methylcytosine-specific restriction protein A
LLPLDPKQKGELADRLNTIAPDGFQIWGVPEGAKTILRDVAEGDAFLLLRTWGEEGRFGYAGTVVGIPRCLATVASKHLWGEDRFPLLLFLTGGPSELPWRDFRAGLGYAANWDPRGQTYPVKLNRLTDSPFSSAAGLLAAALKCQSATMGESNMETDHSRLNFVPTTPEGRRQLVLHYRRERNASLVAQFKKNLPSFSCEICSFDFGDVYGLLGSGYIEAHHTKPVGEMQEGDLTTLESLVPVCSNCHRMLHRRWPPLSLDEVREARRNTNGAS